jgi:hypothetical protein
MAGEWIPYDVCLPQKPEVLELVDRTGLASDQVVGRLLMLWGWAALNSSDGTARMSVRLLGRICGGDEDFWREVEAVGWLVIDGDNGTVAIPGWERRFSKSAKTRAMHSVRADDARARTGACAVAHGSVRKRAPERRDRGDRTSSSSPGDAAQGDQGSGPAGPPGWDTLRKAWAAGTGRPWKLPDAPDKVADRLAEEGWFQKALAAIEALPRCKYVRDPVTLPQLVAPGFVDKVLGGQFDNPREQRGGPRPGDERRPAAESAAEWQRRAADPEAAKRRQEYLDAKARKAEAGGEPRRRPDPDDDFEAARAEVLRKLREGVA